MTVWQVASNMKRQILDLAGAKGALEAVVARYVAVAEALGRNAEPLVDTVTGIEKERAAHKKALRDEARRFDRLMDASNRLLNALAGGDVKKIASARKRYAIVCGNRGGVEREPVGGAMGALWALARAESWGSIHLATGQEGTTLIVKTVPIWNGSSTERHPREGARVAIMQMFDIDVDAPGAESTFFDVDDNYDGEED